jgi:hypothetical protein
MDNKIMYFLIFLLKNKKKESKIEFFHLKNKRNK